MSVFEEKVVGVSEMVGLDWYDLGRWTLVDASRRSGYSMLLGIVVLGFVSVLFWFYWCT